VSVSDSEKSRWVSRHRPRLDEIAQIIAERQVAHDELMARVEARYGDLIAAFNTNTMTDELGWQFAAASRNDRHVSEFEVLRSAFLRWAHRRPRSREADKLKRERRRAQIALTADGTWPHWRQLLQEDGPACALCGKDVVPDSPEYRRRPSVDHIEPLFLGGAHQRTNAQLTHFTCNSDKGAIIV
jgi:5-methylcytosine-specific restriction endonuclease McrA